jgi:diguanylate cyclase
LQEATRSLKDVIYKQGVLKNSIDESNTSVKNMMTAFIDRLNAMATSAGVYQDKMDLYKQIRNTNDANEVSNTGNILDETRVVQSVLRSRDIIVAAQKEVTGFRRKIIKGLEDKLAQMSELVREDQLMWQPEPARHGRYF